MKIGKIQQQTLELVDAYQEFELIEYIKGRSAKVKLKCLQCGFEFERYAVHFNKYPHICPKCHPKGVSQRLPIEEVQKRTDKVYGLHNLKITQYNGNNSMAEIKCLRCGKIFQRVPTVLWRNRSKGCPYCNHSFSIGEKAIQRFLEFNKIQYITQYRFEDCKYKIYLPFDFYLPQYNTCIEFQGEQHYSKRSLFYDEEINIRDKIKKDFCENNNIKLIIIPYWDVNNIESYLNFTGKN